MIEETDYQEIDRLGDRYVLQSHFLSLDQLKIFEMIRKGSYIRFVDDSELVRTSRGWQISGKGGEQALDFFKTYLSPQSVRLTQEMLVTKIVTIDGRQFDTQEEADTYIEKLIRAKRLAKIYSIIDQPVFFNKLKLQMDSEPDRVFNTNRVLSRFIYNNIDKIKNVFDEEISKEELAKGPTEPEKGFLNF